MRNHVLYDEEKNYQSRGINLDLASALLPLLKPHLKAIMLCGALLLGYSVLSIVGPLLIRHAIDINFVQKDMAGLLKTVFLYTLTLVGSFFFAYWQRINLEKVGQKIIQVLRERLFERISRYSLSFFDHHSVGSIISRIESDTESLRLLFTDTVVTLLGDLLVLMGMFVVMFAVHWGLASILFTIMPILFITIYFYNIKGAPYFLAVRRQMAVIYGFLDEYIRGIFIVQAFRRETKVSEWMNTANAEKARIDYKAEFLVIVFINFIFFMNTIGIVLVLWYGSVWAIEGTLTIGTLVMFLAYIRRFFGPLFHLSEQINIIQRAFAGAERIFEVLRQEPEIISPVHPVKIEGKNLSVAFENVSFAYTDEHRVLKDVTFTIPAGEKWALVGPTGGGKSTIINLLLRFYDPQQGRILFNGADIKTLALPELRQRIGLVLQDIYLFPMDIRENLRMEQETISDEEIWRSLQTVNAGEFMEKQQQGLDTELAERGANLSMGERQLLSFARALLHDPEILILDEATSSVDPMTERKIQSALKVLLQGRTSIIIAHRLQTILACDHIMVIRHGEIIEQGNHRELLQQQGFYYKLYHLQHHETELTNTSIR